MQLAQYRVDPSKILIVIESYFKIYSLDFKFFWQRNPKLICAAIDLYFKGVSLRKVADHIKQ
ncbi:MAG: hypothetical protein KGH88_09125, partial [Thaumarchaeota archaeon]|nr:hypothetical protein [Nitrososphaerota archaeon]